MRKALIVGINYYEYADNLHGCVSDANAVKSILERNADQTKNFDVRLKTATSAKTVISRKNLKNEIEDLFKYDDEVALFYFAGHGHIESTGGYILTSDCRTGDDGVALSELFTIVNRSKVKNKLIVLDSCHSGAAATKPAVSNYAELSEGTTILTASAEEQYAKEENGSGVFTSLFVDALNGAAGNLVGAVSPGSVYAHIDQTLGPWEQRPIFRTNVKNFISLRKVQPPISLEDLHELIKLFPAPHYEFALDPGFEPDSPNPDKSKTDKFAILQRYNRVNLVVPVGETHMYFSAMNSRSCKLTPLGRHYWKLVKLERI